ncbi:hypothetical protein KP509_32G021200 [Ceratopteris richardii]|uniref:glutamate dehydrogenase (NADP(+)) n=1 Tax=Ceratopteris richardii TaxID=49495 RepID=A0A8T2QTQ6_CERRI|nr:hypothetical protein KP509_32G021200 [Ceratopteris richardii]
MLSNSACEEMSFSARMNASLEEMNLLQQARGHGLVGVPQSMVREMSEEIDLEIGPGDDDPSFSQAAQALVGVESDEQKHLLMVTGHHDELAKLGQQPRKKKKVVKKWRDEWADTYKWAYVAVHEGTHRIFCSVCKDFGRKHRRNPYGNEGSRNMQMSALEEHNNSLLHKEALRLQMASKDKNISTLERPMYIKALLSKSSESVVDAVMRRDRNEHEYVQAIQELVHCLEPVLAKHPQYVQVLERFLEPERVIMFRVPWVDDKGEAHVNRGFRVQFNRSLGPYRGGLRFHPNADLSVMKVLGLEQAMKNALAANGFGGAGGGSDFDPKGKSENEVMRFCQSFMQELYTYLGPTKDYPLEDMGVGPREISYLFGQYKRLKGCHEGNFSGPRNLWSGFNMHTEATGYGLVHFAKFLLADFSKDIRGLRCVVSGSGKIALHVVEKLFAVGAIPITVSDSRGYLYDEAGFDDGKLRFIRQIKSQQKSLREYTKSYPRAKYCDDCKPWAERCDVAFPCATQNELNHFDATALVGAGCHFLIEGSSGSS